MTQMTKINTKKKIRENPRNQCNPRSINWNTDDADDTD